MAILTAGNKEFDAFRVATSQLMERLAPAADKKDLEEVAALLERFQKKTDDFSREDRKLNIGVIGQVKAGKSSFLNTLLFKGQEVLPKASTPKTAALTKMEYAEKNVIHIEYYSEKDWQSICKSAAVDGDGEIVTASRELKKMAEERGLDVETLLRKGTEDVAFDTYEDLVAHLNDYVGEDGRYQPVVKAVTLQLHNDAFKGISIVDTPGLNDPVASRTVRTQEFMEVCDVVFFLSQAGSFLDKSDMVLLTTQLPQKGVKKVILIASKCDSGLRDILRKPDEDDPFGVNDDTSADTIDGARRILGKKLRKRARKATEEKVKELESFGAGKEIIDVVRQCTEPVLLSAMTENMSGKSRSSYTAEEKMVYDGLKPFSGHMEEDLKIIGNFDAVRRLYNEVVREKEAILEKKAAEFIPVEKGHLRTLLQSFYKKAENHRNVLEHGSKEELEEQKQTVEGQIHRVRSDVKAIFGEVLTRMEEKKGEGIQYIRNAQSGHHTLRERAGEKTWQEAVEVSDSKWYKPWTWFKSHTEYYTHTEHYQYCLAADAVRSLNQYADESVSRVEKIFQEVLNFKELRRKLMKVVADDFDTGSETFDAALFRGIVEDAVQKVTFPVFRMDVSDAKDEITSRFSGEVVSASDKNALSSAVQDALGDIFDHLCTQMEEETAHFRKMLTDLSETLTADFLHDIQEEFASLSAQYDHQEREVERYKDYEVLLKKEMEAL